MKLGFLGTHLARLRGGGDWSENGHVDNTLSEFSVLVFSKRAIQVKSRKRELDVSQTLVEHFYP